MSNPKISIIVPIYNVEEYLEETLNCLVNQTFIEDIEVLMIDDGSTDNSRYIIEKYALDYENFYAFHKQNEGLSITRNFGIEISKGEYIQFFDGDDYLKPETCEKLYNLAKKNDSEIVTSPVLRLKRYNIIDGLFFKKCFNNIPNNINSTKFEDVKELLYDLFTTNKLYKKEFIEKNKIRFINEKILYEDSPFALEAYCLANKITITKEPFYHWRYRENDNTSITQQILNIKNFYDRLKIIESCLDIVEETNMSKEFKNALYLKILNYDLSVHYKRFNQYDEKFYIDLINKTNKILDIIPTEIKEKLNSMKKIICKMVENNDIEGLKLLSKLNLEIEKNPDISRELGDEYQKYIDFERDAIDEELIVKTDEIFNDEDNIFIKFTEQINYLKNDFPHKTKIKLIEPVNNTEHNLKLNTEGYIVIPTNLINNEKYYKIKVEYIAENFKKEAYLRNSKRKIIEYDQFDIEIGIEINRPIIIKKRLTNNLNIKIENIDFKNNIFEFTGLSSEKIDNIYIENVINFKKISYPIISNKINAEFKINFSIPYNDIISEPVKKWELKTENKFKTIKVPQKFEFYKTYHKILITNIRNKLLISDDFYNIVNEVNKLKNDNIKLKNNNKKLKKENIKLKRTIKLYKSRFSVKFTDKIKRTLK